MFRGTKVFGTCLTFYYKCVIDQQNYINIYSTHNDLETLLLGVPFSVLFHNISIFMGVARKNSLQNA